MLTHIPEIRKRENRMSVCCHFSCVQLFVTLWTVARQAPLFMGFSRQEYWSGLPFPSPGDLPNPGIESASLMSPALAGRFFTISATWEAPLTVTDIQKCHLRPWIRGEVSAFGRVQL